MGLNFRKSIKICKGVSVNLNKTGVGVSLSGNGCRYSLNSSGRSTFSLPGTGLSYTTGSSTKKKSGRTYKSAAQKKKEQLAKEKAALAKAQQQDAQKAAKLQVEEYENYLDLIRSVHKECEEPVDWNAIAAAAPPFDPEKPGPREQAAIAARDSYKPSVMESIFRSKADKHRQTLEEAAAQAHSEDAAELQSWQEGTAFAKRVLSGDVDAYLEAIETANPFEDFSDYGSDLEFGTEKPGIMEIEFRVKSAEVVPEKSLSLTKTGKLSEKAMSKTAYFDITQDYVCSCAVRLARELFAVLPVEQVLVHAVDGMLDTATGNDTEETILSVAFDREGFRNINFDRIDPSDFVCTFPIHMGFTKTGGFKEVQRLTTELL